MKQRLTNYLIVLSFDCLSGLDFPVLQKLPNFCKLLSNGAYCKKVETIYPSVTYPCHATIVTGNFPNRHGVVNNTFIQPGRSSPDWYWHRYHINGTTLYDEARKAGLSTAAILWPVTAKAKIDYNMPEIFANRPWLNQIAVSLRNGSPFYQLEMNQRFGSIRNELKQPELDDFVLEATVQTIESKKPNLLLVHFTDLDTQRHEHGFSSQQAMDALRRHDVRLGRILQALKSSGIYENSTIIALGDHSALNESTVIKLNVLFREKNLIQVNKRGKVTCWKAYCKSCDGSAYIYLKNNQDNSTKKVVHDLLLRLLEDQRNGIENILTGEEAGRKGADPNCAFMIEAQRGFYFEEEMDGEYLHPISNEEIKSKRFTKSCHGYSPEKADYHTIFIAKGKGIRPNIIIPSMHLVDEGPTFARLLGLDLGKTDGQEINNLLDNS